jgi:2-keto-4-pentenoate hydratase/2-oxohepta-3-ene-1,7-dioic acid hydratase in catechol pathway
MSFSSSIPNVNISYFNLRKFTMEFFDKIVCVGKNYLEHAKELGEEIPSNPVLFLKPPSILRQATQWNETISLSLPSLEEEIHYECEIVLRLKKGGYQLSLKEAQQAIGFVTIGLDMTKRILQSELKKNGHPWTTAKVFVDSAVIGPWISINEFPDYRETEFSLFIQDSIRQQALPNQMRMNPAHLIAYCSTFFPLCENDIIFTGTPSGVGKINLNDKAIIKWGNYQYSAVWNS